MKKDENANPTDLTDANACEKSQTSAVPLPDRLPSAQCSPCQWFNVKDFGAVGDGSGDDTAFIQAAIDAAIANGGGVVYFPPGTYPVVKKTEPGVLSAFSLSEVSNLVFMGDGPASTIKVKDGTYRGDFMIFRLLAGTTRITFLGLRFDGNKDNIAADEQTHSIEIVSADEIHIERCWFDNTFGDGIRILGRGESPREGEQLDMVEELIIRDCRFKDWGRSGIGCQRAFKHTRITGNLFESNSGDQAIDFEPSGNTSPAEIIIDGNIISHTKTVALTLGGVGGDDLSQRVIVTNNLINCSVFGLRLKHFTFTNNVVIADNNRSLPALSLIRSIYDGLIADNIMVSSGSSKICLHIGFNNGIAPARLTLARNIISSQTTGVDISGVVSMQVLDNIIQTNKDDDQGSVGIRFSSPVEGFPVDDPVVRGNLVRNFETAIQLAPRENDIHNADISHNRLENCTNGIVFATSDTGHGLIAPQLMGNIFDGVTTAISKLQNANYLVIGGAGSGSVSIFGGNGSPENVVQAPVGSMFMRFDGTPGNTLYIKESGTGNSGWIAK